MKFEVRKEDWPTSDEATFGGPFDKYSHFWTSSQIRDKLSQVNKRHSNEIN